MSGGKFSFSGRSAIPPAELALLASGAGLAVVSGRGSADEETGAVTAGSFAAMGACRVWQPVAKRHAKSDQAAARLVFRAEMVRMNLIGFPRVGFIRVFAGVLS